MKCIFYFNFINKQILFNFSDRKILEKNFNTKDVNISNINQTQNISKFNKETLQFTGNAFINVNNTNQETSKIKNNLESRMNMQSNSIFQNNYKNDTSTNDLTEKYCVNCFIDIPIRGKHCKICRSCIATFDHHCVWLGNCIGENNRKYFLLFLFLHSLELIFNLGLVDYIINKL